MIHMKLLTAVAGVGTIAGAAALLQVPVAGDWLARAVDVATVLLVPIGSALLTLVWDTRKKVTATWHATFGRPEIREDHGLIGAVKNLTRSLDRIDRDLDRLCNAAGIARAEIRE